MTRCARFCLGAWVIVAGANSTGQAAAPIKLNGPLVAGGDINTTLLEIDPTGNFVVYGANQESLADELFAVPITGGTSIKLNPTPVAGGQVTSGVLEFTPDGSRALYLADQETDNVNELFSVPIVGGAATKISGTLVAGGDVVTNGGLLVSPDGGHVLFRADKDTDNVVELYSVSPTGGPVTKLNGALVAGGAVSIFGLNISPDSSRVIYLADQITENVAELFSVPIAGGPATKLNETPVTGVDRFSLQFTPDGSHVIYTADLFAGGVLSLFSVMPDGGLPVQLDSMFPTVAGLTLFPVSPDSSRIVYVTGRDFADQDEIFSVPVGGGEATKLNSPLSITQDVIGDKPGPAISPDGTKVLYRADLTVDDAYDLHVVPITGGTSIQLSSLIPGGSIDFYQFSPDGSHVVYLADQDSDEVRELYTVPSTGGTPIKLNGPLIAGGDVTNTSLQFTPEGDRIVYIADQDVDQVGEVFIVPSAGGVPVRINAPLVAGGTVSASGVSVSPDGSRLIYAAEQDTDNVLELYSRVIKTTWNAGSGDWDTDANWNNEVAPDEVMATTIESSTTVSMSGAAGRTAFSLKVGGGGGSSTLELESDAELTVVNGLTIASGGVVRGDGRVNANVTNAVGGEMRVGIGERLQIDGESFANSGRVEALGTAGAPAEIEIEGAAVNSAGTGLIAGRHSLMRFDGGLSNEGSLAVSFGESDLFGDIDNTGSIAVSGGAHATFYDDVVQNGVLQVSKAGSTTSVAVFFGAVTGTGGGTGGGDIFLEGDLRPGNSPATVVFENNVGFGPGAKLEFELGGTTPGNEYDQIVVTGDLVLGGTLVVGVFPGFTPSAGDSFHILEWGSRDGTFADLDLEPLAGLAWDTSDLYVTGDIRLLAAGPLGDFNHDGRVDAGDYVRWRNNFGDADETDINNNGDGGDVGPSDYLLWKSHYGEPEMGGGGIARLTPPGAPGPGAKYGVPEPAGIALLLAAAGSLLFAVRR